MEPTTLPKYTMLCIPRMQKSISIEYIQQIFNKLNVGKIIKITDMVLRNDTEYKRILIHIVWATNNPRAIYIQTRLSEGKNIKLVHNNPWYWKVVMGRPMQLSNHPH